MGAALGDLDEVDLFLDPAPNIRRDVWDVDLFGQLNHKWQHFFVDLSLEGFIPLHEFFDTDQWKSMQASH